jgi:hypothetical protein
MLMGTGDTGSTIIAIGCARATIPGIQYFFFRQVGVV